LASPALGGGWKLTQTSASSSTGSVELFTRYLNTAFAVTQEDYSNLGRLMITAGLIGLLPLLAVPLRRRQERAGG